MASSYLISLMISIRLFMIIEKTATPSNKIMEPMNFSILLLGLKSPYPMVDRVVIAQYHSFIITYHTGISL